MRLLTWNIQWCLGMDGRIDPARIAREARRIADPDVLCLQEVAEHFAGLEGGPTGDQAGALAGSFPGYAHAAAWALDLAGGAPCRQRFGNLILSRWPIRAVRRHALPWPPEADLPSMPRVALEALIETPLGPLRVTTTHLEYYSLLQRAAQLERLRELHAEACAHARRTNVALDGTPLFDRPARPASAIVCGDFNLPPDDALYARMLAPFGEGIARFADAWRLARPGEAHASTFRVHERGAAPYCCDYVFVSEDLAARVAEARIDSATQASDHLPLVVTFA